MMASRSIEVANDRLISFSYSFNSFITPVLSPWRSSCFGSMPMPWSMVSHTLQSGSCKAGSGVSPNHQSGGGSML